MKLVKNSKLKLTSNLSTALVLYKSMGMFIVSAALPQRSHRKQYNIYIIFIDGVFWVIFSFLLFYFLKTYLSIIIFKEIIIYHNYIVLLLLKRNCYILATSLFPSKYVALEKKFSIHLLNDYEGDLKIYSLQRI